MKPGKPLTFATIEHGGGPGGGGSNKRLLVFGLPGNPVSSLVTFALVVLPCLRKLAGWRVRLSQTPTSTPTRSAALSP